MATVLNSLANIAGTFCSYLLIKDIAQPTIHRLCKITDLSTESMEKIKEKYPYVYAERKLYDLGWRINGQLMKTTKAHYELSLSLSKNEKDIIESFDFHLGIGNVISSINRKRVSFGYKQKVGESLLPENPTLFRVLDCLVGDANTIDENHTFEEWCDCLGYNSDSRKDHQIYEACCKTYTELRPHLFELYSIIGEANN